MYLDCTCANISLSQWKCLMKRKRKISYEWIKRKIKKGMPDLYKNLCLEFYNPWEDKTYSTKTHYILTHSAIEYFIRK